MYGYVHVHDELAGLEMKLKETLDQATTLMVQRKLLWLMHGCNNFLTVREKKENIQKWMRTIGQ